MTQEFLAAQPMAVIVMGDKTEYQRQIYLPLFYAKSKFIKELVEAELDNLDHKQPFTVRIMTIYRKDYDYLP